MAVFLLILKIIGIVLAALLCIAVAIICIVLFVPVRYRVQARGSKDAKRYVAGCECSWLLRMVVFQFAVRDGERRFRLRIAGFTVAKSDGSKENEGHQEVASEKECGYQEETLQKDNPRQEALSEKERGCRTQADKKEESCSRDKEGPAPADADRKKRTAGRGGKAKTTPSDMDGSLMERLERLAGHIRHDVYTVRRFLHHPAHRYAFGRLWQFTTQMGRHVAPKKICGKVRYGFLDPALTGWCTGLVYMVFPDADAYAALCPDYEKSILAGKGSLSGRIRLSCPVRIAIRILADKRIMRTYKDIKKLKLYTFKGE